MSASAGSLSPASFVLTNTPVNAPPPFMGISIWPDTSGLVIRSASSGVPVEVGVKFRSDVAGSITGIRFLKVFSIREHVPGSLLDVRWDFAGNRRVHE